MYCPNCSKELPNDASFCSYCGAQLTPPQPQQEPPTNYAPQKEASSPFAPPSPPAPQKEPGDSLATASLVCGIFSVVLFCCTIFPLPIAAIVLGAISKSQGNTSSKSTVGIICGIVGLILSVIVFIISIVYLVVESTYPAYYYW